LKHKAKKQKPQKKKHHIGTVHPRHGDLLKLAKSVPHVADLDFKSNSDLVTLKTFMRGAMSSLGLSKEYHAPLLWSGLMTSTVGAVINWGLADSTGIAAAFGWSQLSTFFDEFRLRRVEFWCEPFNKYSKTTTISGPIAMYYDDDSYGVLSAFSLLAANQQHSNTDDLWSQERKRVFNKPTSDIYLNAWQTTASIACPGGLLSYADSLSASITYARVWVRYWCDFRQIA